MFFFLIINFFGILLLKNTEIGISLIGKGIPIVRAVNEEIVGIRLISYVDIIKSKFLSQDVFIELPEDSVELEPQNIEEENVIEEKIETKNNYDIKSVTLDWKNEFKNNTKYSVDVEALKREKLSFDLKKKDTEVIIYHTHRLTGKYQHGIPADSRAGHDPRYLKPEMIDDKLNTVTALLSEIAGERGQTLSQLALQWTLRDNVVTSTLIGASKPQQIIENIGCLHAPALTQEELTRIEAALTLYK